MDRLTRIEARIEANYDFYFIESLQNNSDSYYNGAKIQLAECTLPRKKCCKL